MRKTLLTLAAVAVLAFPNMALADTLAPRQGVTVTPVAGGFTYDYTLDLTGVGSTVASGGSSFWTLIDFAGFISVVGTPTDWSATTQPFGDLGFNSSPPDGSGTNITWTYTGSGDSSSTTWTGFIVKSMFGPGTQLIHYSSQDLDSSFNLKGDQGTVPGPIPEPASMLLLGSGLLGIAGFARRKIFKKS